MKNKKLVKAGVSLLLVGVIGVGATLAYLSDTTETMRNTFTVGKGYDNTDEDSQALVLDEAALNGAEANSNFTKESEPRTLNGVAYTFMPGSTYEKDPDVHLRADSVASYVFIKIDGLDALLNKTIVDQDGVTKNYFTAVKYNDSEGINPTWDKVASIRNGDHYDGYYVYTVDKTPLVIDDNLTTEDDKNGVKYYDLEKLFTELIPNDTITTLPVDNPKTDEDERVLGNIDIKACAVQAQNREDDVGYINAQEQAIGLLSAQ